MHLHEYVQPAATLGIVGLEAAQLDPELLGAAAAGNSFIISHEPTFWSADDGAADFRDDPLFDRKMAFIEQSRLVVFRFHDHWHARKPDGISAGWNRRMGWETYYSPEKRSYEIPETTLEALARDMQQKLKVRSARMIGDPKMKVTRVAHCGHYIAQAMRDASICGLGQTAANAIASGLTQLKVLDG